MKGTLLLIGLAFWGGFVVGKLYYQPDPWMPQPAVMIDPTMEAYLAPLDPDTTKVKHTEPMQGAAVVGNEDVVRKDPVVKNQAGVSSAAPTAISTPQFRCDGRRYCSEMTSKQEAEYFMQHCPNHLLDGDGNGIACEHAPAWLEK